MCYKSLLSQIEVLIKSQPNIISVYANVSSFVYHEIANLNWVGFYLFDNSNLTVGPFCGKVACSTIAPGKGVVGTCFLNKKTIVIKDVHKVINHIQCDNVTSSEVCIPLIINNHVIGVFDIDSPIINRFDDALVLFLEKIVYFVTEYLKGD